MTQLQTIKSKILPTSTSTTSSVREYSALWTIDFPPIPPQFQINFIIITH